MQSLDEHQITKRRREKQKYNIQTQDEDLEVRYYQYSNVTH